MSNYSQAFVGWISQARERKDTVPTSGNHISVTINKGTKKKLYKEQMIQGDDLKGYFRIEARDPEQVCMIPEEKNGNRVPVKKPLGRVLYDIFGSEPGTEKSRIVCRIVNFDTVIAENRMNLISGGEEGKEMFIQALERWATVRALAKRKNGRTIAVAQTDAHFKYLIMNRIGTQPTYYEPHEQPIDEHVVFNTPKEAGEHYLKNSKSIKLGNECYLYEMSNGEKKMCLWKYEGYLEFLLPSLLDVHLDLTCAFRTHAKNDFMLIMPVLSEYAQKAARLNIPLSTLEFELWRKEHDVSIPAWGQGTEGKSIQELREEGTTGKKWLVHLTPTHETMSFLIRVAEEQRERIMLEAGQSPLLLANKMYPQNGYEGDDNRVATPVEVPTLERDPFEVFEDEDIDEGEFTEEKTGFGSEWFLTYIEDVKTMNAKKFFEFSKSEWNIYPELKVKQLWSKLLTTWSKSPDKRVETFAKTGLYFWAIGEKYTEEEAVAYALSAYGELMVQEKSR